MDKDYFKQYYKDNKERLDNYHREYVRQHYKEIREYNKKYQQYRKAKLLEERKQKLIDKIRNQD
jgi:DNA-directed RNA polymerase beta' subunit